VGPCGKGGRDDDSTFTRGTKSAKERIAEDYKGDEKARGKR
jgi:hypothetical protein